MSDRLPYRVIDVFAERPYRGNPAGVVLDADGLSDEQMQRIAAEINASETAFVSRLSDLHRPPRLRWFTRTTEVRFCGHATLAAAHALDEAGRLADLPPSLLGRGMGEGSPATPSQPPPKRGRGDAPPLCDAPARPDNPVLFDTAAGELRLHAERLPAPRESTLWWLAMPDPALKPDHTNPIRTCELLGITPDDLDPGVPAMRTRDDDVIYVVQRWQTLVEMQPRFDELAQWCRRSSIRGICVATTATLTDVVNVHSRFFAPAVGVNEDPVTGSVHGPLAVLLVVNGLVGSALGRSALWCAQGRPGDRSGLVRALVEATPQGYQVSIAGQCWTTLAGELRLPPRS